LQLTLAELPVVVPQSQHIQGALARWRDQVLAAVSMLAALLDERVAQRELLENLIVYDSTGSRPWASVDTGVRVRDFLPRNRVLLEQRQLLEQLASFDLSQERAEGPLRAESWRADDSAGPAGQARIPETRPALIPLDKARNSYWPALAG
jgi:hypothetical protein